MQSDNKQPQKQATQPTQPQQADTRAGSQEGYDSNPFSSGWAGIQKLLRHDVPTLIGAAVFYVTLFIIMLTAILVVALATVVFLARHQGIGELLPVNMFSNISDGNLYATWVIGAIILLVVIPLTQALVARLTVAAAKSTAIHFGQLLKDSLRAALPILGYFLIIIGVVIIGSIFLDLLGQAIGLIVAVLYLVAALAVLYCGVRMSYVLYTIVDQHAGPVAAIQHSWKLSGGHFVETIGSASAGLIAVAIPEVVIQLILRGIQGATVLEALLVILSAIATGVVMIAGMMPLAERYAQLQAVTEGRLAPAPLSPMNYVALLAAMVTFAVVSAVAPKQDSTFNDANGLFKSQYTLPSDSTDMQQTTPSTLY